MSRVYRSAASLKAWSLGVAKGPETLGALLGVPRFGSRRRVYPRGHHCSTSLTVWREATSGMPNILFGGDVVAHQTRLERCHPPRQSFGGFLQSSRREVSTLVGGKSCRSSTPTNPRHGSLQNASERTLRRGYSSRFPSIRWSSTT
jgi:hypothetical protein